MTPRPTRKRNNLVKNTSFPPRSKIHPSNKLKLVKIFHGILLLSFVIILIVMVIWGIRFLE